MGYRSAATGIFGLMFYAFDLGTMNLLNRFIGESNVKDPKKMILYIQYFIWYQMITGLVQTTAISLYALFIVPRQELAYAIWIMLIYSTVQYPGFLGIFRGILGALQQYHRTIVLNFIAGEFFQRITEIGFVILGRWYGQQNPVIGEILGIAIGATIGFYIDDFIATAVSAYFFQKYMKGYGIRVKDCFRHDFDKELVKTCLYWGIRSGLPNFMWTLNSFISLALWITYVPQYTTFLALSNVAGAIGTAMGISIDLGGAISESFFNGKKVLAKYYVSQAFRYTGILQCLMLSGILLVLGVIEPIFMFLQLEQYVLGIAFIIPKMIREIQQPYNNIAENTTTSTGHVNFQMAIDIFEAVFAIFSNYLFIAWLKIPQTFGFRAIIWLIPCAELPAILAKVILSFIYVNKKILKVQIPIYQTIIGPLITTLIIFYIGEIYIKLIFNPLSQSNMWIAIILSIFFLIGVVIFVYFPLTGLIGVWDPSSIEQLRRAVKISGPGKIFTVPMFKALEFAVSKSKLHGKFGVDDSEAIKEARELMVIKNSHREKKIEIV
jgi:predicted small integral membrane protein